MSAERLRAAATLLRERAEAQQAVDEAWGPMRIMMGAPSGETERKAHEFWTLWSPPVALALADWLGTTTSMIARDTERLINDYEGNLSAEQILDYEGEWLANHPALAVADAILGDAAHHADNNAGGVG